MYPMLGGTEPAVDPLAESTLFGALSGGALFVLTTMAMTSALPAETAGANADILLDALHRLADNVSTVAFALSGAFVAAQHLAGRERRGRAAFLVTLAAGVLTGVGGGLMRDLLAVGRTPAILAHPSLAALALLGAGAGHLLSKQGGGSVSAAIDAADFLSVGLTAVVGFTMARELAPDASPATWTSSAALITMVTACGGGLVRDILLLRRPPYAFTSPYLLLTLAASLLYSRAHVAAGLATSTFDWPLMAVAVAGLGMLTRRLRISPPGSTPSSKSLLLKARVDGEANPLDLGDLRPD